MEVVRFSCDRCDGTKDIPYEKVKTRSDIHRSFYGELSLPCSCGGRYISPYHIRNGFITTPVIIVNDEDVCEADSPKTAEQVREETRARLMEMLFS